MLIRSRTGEAYLRRLRIIDTPWFGVYLHDIDGPDPQPDPHDHPWPFVSVVLRGGYAEKVFVYVEHEYDYFARTHVRQWIAGSWHKMPAEGKAHFIVWALPRTRTLILRGKRSRDWGFWILDTDWRQQDIFNRGMVNLTGWTLWKDYEL